MVLGPVGGRLRSQRRGMHVGKQNPQGWGQRIVRLSSLRPGGAWGQACAGRSLANRLQPPWYVSYTLDRWNR